MGQRVLDIEHLGRAFPSDDSVTNEQGDKVREFVEKPFGGLAPAHRSDHALPVKLRQPTSFRLPVNHEDGTKKERRTASRNTTKSPCFTA
jgi:hypothetical protein